VRPRGIPADHPEACLHVGHRWTDWGRYTTLPVKSLPVPRVTEEVPRLEHIAALRVRGCPRCAAVEGQNWHGVSGIVDDPHRIELRRGWR
jgi:hypothetical protein